MGLFFLFFLPCELSPFLFLVVLLVWEFNQENLCSFGSLIDPISWSMTALSLFLSGVILSSSKKSRKMSQVVVLSGILVVVFFLTEELMIFFIMFELSLVPLLLLLAAWGNQAERLKATQFMLVYTVLGSAPLLFLVFWMISENSSSILWSILEEEFMFPSLILGMSVLAFLVKIPSFFFHSWLPKAHVEAPLEGSMILAGVMLKVGSFGLVRIFSLLKISQSMSETILSLSLFGSAVASLIALTSDDMKMSVAFSSISHMNMVVAAISSFKLTGLWSAIIVMIAHGVCSPLLFSFVTMIYKKSNSRSSLVSKGVVASFPFFWFIGLILWSMNLSPPPFMSFSGEVLGFSAVVSSFYIFLLWVIIFLVLSSFYSIVNFGVQSHSFSKLPFKGSSKEMWKPLLSLGGGFLSFLLFFFPLSI